MSKCHGELTQREKELLKIRRDSDTKAAELVKMERMLEQTKNKLEKKTESTMDSTGYQENMGIYVTHIFPPVCLKLPCCFV